MGRLVSLHSQRFLAWLKHLGRIFIVRINRVICGKYTQMKVVVWTVLPLWDGMWTRRYLWTSHRRQYIWWVGTAMSARWIFSEKYFWRLIHWRGNGSRKWYIWRRVQVFSFWVKEEFGQNSFSRPGSDWGVIGERLGEIGERSGR